MGDGSSAGGGIAGLGVVLIAIGVLAYVYPEEQATYLGLSSQTIYPYREIGELLLIFGIITTVIGGVVAAVASSTSTSSPPPQQVTQHYYQQPTHQPQQQQQKYCSNCGISIPVDSALCPYCGQNIGR